MIGLLMLGLALAAPEPSRCNCDPARPETMEARECSLCREAEKQPPGLDVFFLKDNNPRKPNRWLALRRAHDTGMHSLVDLPAKERTTLWTAAIAKAREMWGDDWGLAYNGDLVRTQCHLHIHMGKLLKGIETRNFIVVNGPAEIPAPQDGTGVWVHSQGTKLHVHLGEQICETVLLR
jgi:hypothetical protein